MSPTRAQAMLALFSQLDIIDTREEPVQAVLSPKVDAWTWGLEVRRMYGTELMAPYRGDRREAIKLALIEGADTWSMLEPPTGEALAAAWAPAVAATRLVHEVGCDLGVHSGDCSRNGRLLLPDDRLTATIPAVPEGTELTWDNAPDDRPPPLATDDDDDDVPERPAIIGATPEEVRRRIDAARAGGLATGVPEPASTETDDLDDLPF